MPDRKDAPTDPAAALTDDADAQRRERRRKLALTGGFVAVLLVIAGALAYATVRDPGPLPPVPPHITGTDDGALKRAIVHYVGALADEDADEVVALVGVDDPRTRALARIVVVEFGEVARKKAEAKVEDTDADNAKTVTITFADDRTQVVDFFKPSPEDTWHPLPQTDAELPDVETGN